AQEDRHQTLAARQERARQEHQDDPGRQHGGEQRQPEEHPRGGGDRGTAARIGREGLLEQAEGDRQVRRGDDVVVGDARIGKQRGRHTAAQGGERGVPPRPAPYPRDRPVEERRRQRRQERRREPGDGRRRQ